MATEDQILDWACNRFGPEQVYADGERSYEEALSWAKLRYEDEFELYFQAGLNRRVEIEAEMGILDA